MKIKFTFLFALLLSFSLTHAQQIDQNKRFDMTSLNRPQSLQTDFLFSNSMENSPLSTFDEDDQLEPLASIDSQVWGIIDHIGTNELIYYSANLNENASFEVKTYDNNFQVLENFSVNIPENANHVELLNHYSEGFFEENTKEFMIYVHYFDEEIIGPEGQISEIWLVNKNGNVLQQVPGEAAWAKIDADGNKKFITYASGEDQAVATSFNLSDFSVEEEYEIDGDLINYFAGVPFNFYTIDGEEKIVVAHYESIFMDNATLEIYPDNHLIIKILDFNFAEENSFELDIQTEEELGQFVTPMADFGKFYKDNRYDISKEYFDSSNDYKIVYGIEFYDMMADAEWNTYRVAKEDGTIIHELNEEIIAVNQDITSIEGEDNQLGLLLGQNGEATQLGFFNIESWDMAATFNADHNGDLLSDNFNRIPTEDSYHYVVGLGEPDMENGNSYGVITELSQTGDEVKRHQFLLPENTILFEPVLTSAFLAPNAFTTEDDDQYFSYAYLQDAEDGSKFYNLVFAKDSENILQEFRGDTEKGPISGANLVMKTDGDSYDKLAVLYDSNNITFQTDFYRIPFAGDLSVDDFTKAELSLYPNPTSDFINLEANTAMKAVTIYNINGQTVMTQSLENTKSTVDISKLNKGMYIVSLQLEDGTVENLKVIKQ